MVNFMNIFKMDVLKNLLGGMFLNIKLLTMCLVRYLHAMHFLRNKMPSPENSKNTCNLVGCSILNALNLEKWGAKIHNCAYLLDFLAPFCYTTCMSSFSRISPRFFTQMQQFFLEGGIKARQFSFESVLQKDWSLNRIYSLQLLNFVKGNRLLGHLKHYHSLLEYFTYWDLRFFEIKVIAFQMNLWVTDYM